MPEVPHKKPEDVYYPIAVAHLVQVPLHRAIVRTAEAVRLKRMPLERPTLDAGCGDGIFAAIAFGQHNYRADLGIDADMEALRTAHRKSSHRLLLCSDLGAIPLASESVGSIVCNSVIEHIPHADRALSEFARILKPRGWLALTTPTPNFTDTLLTVRILKWVGLRRLAAAYGRWFNRISHHYTLLSPETWASKLSYLGFRVTHTEHYLDSVAMAAFELAHYLEAYRLAIEGLVGRWVLFPRLAALSPTTKLKATLIGRLCARKPHGRAGYAFLLAQKVSEYRGML